MVSGKHCVDHAPPSSDVSNPVHGRLLQTALGMSRRVRLWPALYAVERVNSGTKSHDARSRVNEGAHWGSWIETALSVEGGLLEDVRGSPSSSGARRDASSSCHE